MSKLFVIYYTPGDSWQEGKPFMEQDLLAHGAFMIKKYSLEAAQAIVDVDPAVVNGVFKARLHPWFSVNRDEYEP